MRVQPKVLRCAVYTRVSTEYGLEQNFNSLDAQREASEAYIKSQSHEGWRLQSGHYDDGGFSGGSLERPALQKLLAAIRQRKIDVVVVYKVDRLTRSLADFAKLVELFDLHDVSFVSVTQSFNTTTSMGRLTLNVLLSFAQFEREVTGERIRDKVAASKRKGMRMGGPVPLGYDTKDKKLVPNPEEAERVRDIFRTYSRLQSLAKTLVELNQRNIVTKQTFQKSGRSRGGIPFCKSGLAHFMKNRVYVGEVVHKGKYFPGEHVGIVDPDLFEEVQRLLADYYPQRGRPRLTSTYLLAGKLFDSAGNRMSPVTARKHGRHYRYYVSTADSQGRQAAEIKRVSADQLEAAVTEKISPRRDGRSSDATDPNPSDVVAKVVVAAETLEIHLNPAGRKKPRTIRIPWAQPTWTRKREIIPPEGAKPDHPIRWENRARLLEGIAKARRWVDELIRKKAATTETIAAREGLSERSVRMTLSLAFLSPRIVAAIIAGAAPPNYSLMKCIDAPVAWSEQVHFSRHNAPAAE